ncbi:sugar transferase [Sediminibacterium sp.]|uniref:sugar transferase n=1 Tax=Sediminibacterium sp. TaxID=1917865 RepID=UPI0025EFD925|nr:sugar transferase [Sediminibacterium sp.]MBT9485471.1 sugar transferase [Sediminibacterium sp.]
MTLRVNNINYIKLIRFFDISLSIIGIILLIPIFLILLIIGFWDTGSPIFKQERVGRNKKPFNLLKFRSMYVETQSVATHLVNVSSITKWGSFLRRSKLDELPQLFNVLNGDMSFVGPRPNLFNQEQLLKERDIRGIYEFRPGITGLAQIKQIDMSTPQLLAEVDSKMFQNYSIIEYFKYISLTIYGNGFGDRVKKK